MLLLVLLLLPQVTRTQSSDPVLNLFTEYHDWKMATNPQAATYAGFHDYADKLDDFSLDAILNIGKKCAYFLEKAVQSLKLPNLTPRDKFYLKILEDETSMCNKGMSYKGYLLPPVDFLSGVQINLGRFFGEENVQRLQNEKDYRTVIRRMRKVPRQIDQIIDLLKLGIQEGITYSNESMFRTKEQFNLLYVSPEQSVFYKQFKKMPSKLRLSAYSSKVVEIQNEAKEVISQKVLPAFKKLEKFLDEEYMQRLRPDPALSSLPNGLELYKGFLEYHTTMSGLTPEYIHEMGVKEVENVKRKMLEVATQLGFGRQDITSFLQDIRDDGEQQFTKRIDKLQTFEDNIEIINSKLRNFFGPQVLHDEVYDVAVKPMQSKTNFRSYYSPPSLDGERTGAFYINVDDITSLKRYETMSLTLHESNPGHHLQETFSKYSDTPNFLKLRIDSWYTPSAPPTYTAFVEGWAQYAEHLGIEMKVFDTDPYQLIGFYSFDLVRSIRLVLDTGIHAFGWTREEAIKYLVTNSAMSVQNCIDEVDRYITWPAQSIAYEIGEKKIFLLRRKFEREQGKNFDIRKFHWHLLSCMGPLESLEECVQERAWHHAYGAASSQASLTFTMLAFTTILIIMLAN